jgi:hypothetical protein
MSRDPSFWLSWAVRVTEGLRNLDPATALGLSDEIRRLADDPAKKLEAIRLFRRQTRLGMQEAKAAVDNYLRGKRLSTASVEPSAAADGGRDAGFPESPGPQRGRRG